MEMLQGAYLDFYKPRVDFLRELPFFDGQVLSWCCCVEMAGRTLTRAHVCLWRDRLLTASDLLWLAIDSQEICLYKGDTVMEQGAVATGFFIMMSGIAEVLKVRLRLLLICLPSLRTLLKVHHHCDLSLQTLVPSDKAFGGPRVVRVARVMRGGVFGERTILCPKGANHAATIKVRNVYDEG
jgi:CRP-like cAMP-binding protein